jgi:hypothetical protein
MDPVNSKALKGKFKDRADKDIDNDGDVDSSDEYLHKRRKAVSKAIGKIKEEVGLDEAATKYVIKHKKTKQVLNTHDDYATAKDEHEGLGADKKNYGVYKQTKKDAALRNRNTYREEVDLDEVSDKKLDAYRQKAFADQPAGDDGSNKYRKRKFGRDLAFAKQTGRAKVRATKEEVELDEAKKDHFVYQKGVPKTKEVVHRGTEQSSKDWIEKNAKHFSHKGRNFDIYKGKYPNVKPSDRLDYRYVAEEVELDEVSTEKLRDYASAALQDKNRAKADKRWKYASKAMKAIGDREAKAAHALKYNKKD